MTAFFSGYQIMWLFVMFDLPTNTKSERREASNFRNGLLDFGFEMAQFSVYTKYCASREKAEAAGNRIQYILPTGGKVDILLVTDKQFSNIRRFYGKKKGKNKRAPQTLQLF